MSIPLSKKVSRLVGAGCAFAVSVVLFAQPTSSDAGFRRKAAAASASDNHLGVMITISAGVFTMGNNEGAPGERT